MESKSQIPQALSGEQTVTLRPMKVGAQRYYTGKINLKTGEPHWITSTMKTYSSSQLRLGDEMLMIKFNVDKTFQTWTYKTGEDAKAHDKEMERAIAIMTKHPQTKVLYGPKNDNANGEPLFTLEFQSERINKEAEMLIRKYDIMNKVMSLTPQEKSDVAFRYGINAIGMTNMDLFVRLCDFNSGALMNDIIPDGEQESAMDHFLESYNTLNAMEELKIVLNKALHYNIFVRNNNGYFLDKEHVGMTKENLIDYLNTNPNMFKFIKEEVERKSTPVLDDIFGSVPKNVDIEKITAEAITLNKMREMGKALRIRGYNNIKDLELFAKNLINGQHLKNELDMYGMRWNRKWECIEEAVETLKHKRIERLDLGQEIYVRDDESKSIIKSW